MRRRITVGTIPRTAAFTSTYTLSLALVLVGLTPSPAAADPAGPTDYRSEIIEVDPPMAEIELTMIGGDAFIQLVAEPTAYDRENGHLSDEGCGLGALFHLRGASYRAPCRRAMTRNSLWRRQWTWAATRAELKPSTIRSSWSSVRPRGRNAASYWLGGR